MKNVKPTLEKISPDFGSSILVKKHTEFLKEIKAFWHFHPEIELVYVNKGKGKRHIGNHLSYFNNSQLLLIGSNLPHNGFTDRLTTNGSETLIQFKPEFLGENFFSAPEMKPISVLFEKAKKGILFGIETKKKLGPKIEKIAEKKGFKQIDEDSTLEPGFTEFNKCADIHISKDERFVYGSNRGENTIAVFERNTKNGKLNKIQSMSVHGSWPRNFAIDPTGKFLLVANLKTENIAVFSIDKNAGTLTYLHDFKTPEPICLLF